MDWAKAKSIFIILFLGLNIFLLFNIIQQDSNSKIVSVQEVNDIKTILASHNIILDASIPKKIKPEAFLKIEEVSYDTKLLIEKFFGKQINKDTVNGVSIYRDGNKKLEIYDNKKLVYYNVTQDNLEGYTKNKLIRYVEDKLVDLSIYPSYGIVSEVLQTKDGYIIKYIQEYNNYKIFGSYINITTTKNGISKIESYWTNPIEFVDTPKDIKTPTEVLIFFAKDIMNTNKVTIKEVSLGYYPPIDEIKNASVSSVPVWAITTGNGKSYYYNAYEGYQENNINN